MRSQLLRKSNGLGYRELLHAKLGALGACLKNIGVSKSCSKELSKTLNIRPLAALLQRSRACRSSARLSSMMQSVGTVRVMACRCPHDERGCLSDMPP